MAIEKTYNIQTGETTSRTFTQSAISSEEALKYLRLERDRRLAETDVWALSDRTMSADMTTYRQALRDITDTYSDLDTVVWPTKP